MMSEERQAQAAAYALGALEPGEATAFESALDADAELRALVREYQEVSALLAAGAADTAPRAELRDRVLAGARVAPMPTKVTPLRSRGLAMLAWAAAAAGLLLAGVQTVRLQRLTRRTDTLASEYRAAADRRDELQARSDAILDGNTQMYAILPTTVPATGPRYGAQVFWRRDKGTWLVHAYMLPKLPEGKVYQLWYVTPDARISAGVFEVDAEGHGVALLNVPAPATQSIMAAMSVEPVGGSPQPTGPIVIAGSVAGS